MAARSVRTSSSEEESRLSDDEERLLTKRSMANASLWKNTCLGVERLKKTIFHDPDSDLMETNLSLTFQGDFCVSMIGRAALRCKKTRSQEMCCTSSSKEDLCRAAARKTQRRTLLKGREITALMTE